MYLKFTLIVGSVYALALFIYVLAGLYKYVASLPGVTIQQASPTTKLVRVHESNRCAPISLAQAFVRAVTHRHS